MSIEDLHRRLKARYSISPVTEPLSSAVRKYLDAVNEHEYIFKQTGITDPELLHLLSLSMLENPKFLTVFTSWLDLYVVEIGEDVLYAIEHTCINFSTGNIRKDKLKKLIRKYRRGNGKYKNMA